MTDKVTAEEFAALIDGNQYLQETSKEQSQLAFGSGLMVIYGYSDDGLCVDGVGAEQYGAWEGGEFKFCKDGTCFCDGWEHHEEALKRGYMPPTPCLTVNAEWCPSDFEGSWRISPDCPHATFKIMEDDDLFCVGAVIDMAQFN